MAKWKDYLYEFDQNVDSNINDLDTERTEAKVNDIGIINQSNGVGILARDNGRLEGYADYGLGFRMDPETQSLSIFAPNLRIFSNSVETHDFNKQVTFIKNEYKDALQIIKQKEGN